MNAKKLLEKVFSPKKKNSQFFNLIIKPLVLVTGDSQGEILFPQGETILLEKFLCASIFTGPIYFTFYDQRGKRIISKTELHLIGNGGYNQVTPRPIDNKFKNGFDIPNILDGYTKIEILLDKALDAGEKIELAFMGKQLKGGL